MKRTKEWWARLTAQERSELVMLERLEARNGGEVILSPRRL